MALKLVLTNASCVFDRLMASVKSVNTSPHSALVIQRLSLLDGIATQIFLSRAALE